MGKFLDALKSFEEFRAPWQTEGGEDAEIDKTKLKRFIYNLNVDKAKAQDAREDALENVKTIEADLETAKAEAASANGVEAQKKIDKLETDLAKAKDRVTELEKADEQRTLRDEVLGDVDKKYHEYITGETREDLEKSLEKFKETFGLSEPGSEDDDNDDDDDDRAIRSQPRSRLKNPIDPKPGNDGDKEIDYDKVADEILGFGRF